MATISRPGKEGNATTYQGKVAAGYTKILAQEVDADIDAIYTAWNQGVDTVNIKDAAVTAPKLAPGAILPAALGPGSVQTAALADGSVSTAKLADNSVTSAKIVNGAIVDADVTSVAWTKLIAPFIALLPITPRGQVIASNTYLDYQANPVGSPSYDNTKPSWLIRLDYSTDEFQVLRAPPPGTAWAYVFRMAADGHFVTPVARASLGVNAISGAAVTAYCPANFALGGPSGWTTVASLPSLTTRGGFVHIHANHTLAGYGVPGGVICNQRILRDLTPIVTTSFNIASPDFHTIAPWPALSIVDTGVAAGSHVYTHQVIVGSGATVMSVGTNDGLYMAIEIG